MKPLKTLFLNPPSFENFDGGASSRWPATREIESYWYPVWLAYPAGMLEGSKLLDAPPHHVSAEETYHNSDDVPIWMDEHGAEQISSQKLRAKHEAGIRFWRRAVTASEWAGAVGFCLGILVPLSALTLAAIRGV